MNGRRLAGLRLARVLMTDFARDTGLDGGAEAKRYLWTDAFAVANYLGLYRATGETAELDRALRLVDAVHHTLGRHRPDDPRHGWISGLPEAEGERHPTRGGLRIGKRLPERRPGEPYDARLEWDRDGQYFHYLTQWMHTLARVAEETGMAVFLTWAVELAETAHARFVIAGPPGEPLRMVWKMSIDLRRALVPSMGQHDPLDAWLACLELRRCAARAASGQPLPLARETVEAEHLCAGRQWATDDALGIGALLVAVFRLARLRLRSAEELASRQEEAGLLAHLVGSARIGLDAYLYGDPLGLPAEARLAFRELGLAIGLHALGSLAEAPALDPATRAVLGPLLPQLPLAGRIDDFWSDPAHRQCGAWLAHREINAVMLATSLAPAGYLGGI